LICPCPCPRNCPHFFSSPAVFAHLTSRLVQAFVQATIEYLLSKLDALHTFSLIVFNHEVVILAELFPCTESNKASLPSSLNSIIFTISDNSGDILVVMLEFRSRLCPVLHSFLKTLPSGVELFSSNFFFTIPNSIITF